MNTLAHAHPHSPALACGTPAGRVRAFPPLVSRAKVAGRFARPLPDVDAAAGLGPEAEAFVGRRKLGSGLRVLDASSGTGAVTIPAARTGATVTGLDPARDRLRISAARARRERLPVSLRRGSVDALPFADGSFDVVLSMFGAMFAPDPRRVVSELARVTRPGGQVVLANWTRSSFVGRMLALQVAAVPPAAGAPSPLLWGEERAVRERFDADRWDVVTSVRTARFHFPDDPPAVAEVFRAAFGPDFSSCDACDPDAAVALAEVADHWIRHHRAPGASAEVEAEYLEVVATRL
jgi:SAM-dependent methyltransferase